jgi:hypothetical protein
MDIDNENLDEISSIDLNEQITQMINKSFWELIDNNSRYNAVTTISYNDSNTSNNTITEEIVEEYINLMIKLKKQDEQLLNIIRDNILTIENDLDIYVIELKKKPISYTQDIQDYIEYLYRLIYKVKCEKAKSYTDSFKKEI